MPDIGENLKKARKAAGIRQEDAANKVGMLRVTLSSIESGKRKVSTDELVKFADLYKVDPDVLLEYSSDTEEAAKKRLEKYLQLIIMQEKFLSLSDNDKQEVLDIIDIKLKKRKE